jgi:hypothetical protein
MWGDVHKRRNAFGEGVGETSYECFVFYDQRWTCEDKIEH